MSLPRALCLLALVASSGCAADPAAPERPAEAAAGEDGARCDACDRPAAPAAAWPDGRASCARCRELAVVGREGLARARGDALSGLERRFGIDLGAQRLSVQLVDRTELSRLAGRDLAHGRLRAFTEVEDSYRGETLVYRQFRIFALEGLPAPVLAGVLAHELFHVHQVLSGGGIAAEETFREGAAQYVQHEVLQELGADEWAERLRADQDPVYGAGLRRFQALVVGVGEERALELGARGRGFPPGY